MTFYVSGCDSYAVLVAISSLTSINTMTVVAVDRFLVIANPTRAAQYITYKTAIICCLMTWLLSTFWACMPLIGWNRYVLEGLPVSCTFDYLAQTKSAKAFIIVLAFGNFLLPLTVMVACYTRVFVIVCRHQRELRNMREHTRMNGNVKTTPSRVEVKVAKISVLILIIFVISWSSYAIIALLYVFGLIENVSPYIASLSGLFAKASSVYNPFVYAISHPRFQKRSRSWLKRLTNCTFSRPTRRTNLDISSGRNSNCHESLPIDFELFENIPAVTNVAMMPILRETHVTSNNSVPRVQTNASVCRKLNVDKRQRRMVFTSKGINRNNSYPPSIGKPSISLRTQHFDVGYSAIDSINGHCPVIHCSSSDL